MKVQPECPICLVEFITGAQLCQLACHHTHMLHQDCYEQWVKKDKEQDGHALCPLCRVEIDEPNVQKKIFKLDEIKSEVKIGETA